MTTLSEAYYGVEFYGDGLYGGTAIIPGTGGGITVSWDLWRATLDNKLLEDVTDVLYGGGATLNHDRALKAQATFDIRDATRISTYTDYLAVFQRVEYDDGRPEEFSQLGLFSTKPPPGTRTIEIAEGQFTTHDLTGVLARHRITNGINIGASINYVSAIRQIAALTGITRHAIQYSNKATTRAISFPIGMSYLEVINALLEAIGYYHLSVTPDGKITSGPSRSIQQVEPYKTLTDADLQSVVTTQPTDTTVANVVIVVQDNPNSAPLTAVRINDDANSPTSIERIGTQARKEPRSDLEDQDAVDALADRLLSEGRTYYQTIRFAVLPDAGYFLPHQTLDLDLTGHQAIFNGRWWIRTVQMGFEASTSGPVIECNRVTDSVEGSLI